MDLGQLRYLAMKVENIWHYLSYNNECYNYLIVVLLANDFIAKKLMMFQLLFAETLSGMFNLYRNSVQ